MYLDQCPADHATVGRHRIEIQIVVQIILLPSNLISVDDDLSSLSHHQHTYLPNRIGVFPVTSGAQVFRSLALVAHVVDSNRSIVETAAEQIRMAGMEVERHHAGFRLVDTFGKARVFQ